MRRGILIALGILALSAAGLAAAVLLLPAERVGSFAAARASAAASWARMSAISRSIFWLSLGLPSRNFSPGLATFRAASA